MREKYREEQDSMGKVLVPEAAYYGALATAFVPAIGYDRAAALAQEAHKTGKTIRETALERQVLSEEEINRILDNMTRPKG
ncbi:MAG: hypothetical protein GY849_12155 [Deltaproteobacteria bacterium]|nr:hypothetical protein [Deltaproteobacteria bacterium]